MHERTASATLHINCGTSSGSGFIYRNSKFALTNYHVIDPKQYGNQIFATSEQKHASTAKVVGFSPADKFDFAILELDNPFIVRHEVLKPKQSSAAPRGMQVI